MRGNLDGAIFSGAFDDEFQVRDGPNRAYFGRNVLRGLIDGIDEALARKRRVRSDGPALLASAMWIDDEELLGTLARLTSVSIVVRKAPRDHYRMPALREANERISGLPLRTFPGFGYMAPKVDGTPQLIGPGDPLGDAVLPAIRSIGYRTTGWAPVVHAKIALLGDQWWHDEDEIGGVADVIGFRAERLWVSSANFTSGSRRNLEFGYWTDEPSLLEGAQRFLLRLIESSEAIDAEGDILDPDLAELKFDDMAFGEDLAEFPPDGDE